MNKNKVILVTGCSSGIGLGLSKSLIKQNKNPNQLEKLIVYASARNLKSIQHLEELGINIIRIDVTNVDSIKNSIEFILEKEGKIDVLINNAGINYFGPCVDIKLEDAKHLMDTNFFGIGGLVATPFVGMYSASKAAIQTWSDSLRMEMSPFNIKVLMVYPGAVESDIVSNAQTHLQSIIGSYNHYESIKEYIIQRSQLSQTNPMTATEFADQIVKKVILSHSPPLHYSYGPGSTYFNFLYVLTSVIGKWYTDALFEKRFGLEKLKQILSAKATPVSPDKND
eukprot:gene1401-1770_t